jgi:hypothetical protein
MSESNLQVIIYDSYLDEIDEQDLPSTEAIIVVKAFIGMGISGWCVAISPVTKDTEVDGFFPTKENAILFANALAGDLS